LSNDRDHSEFKEKGDDMDPKLIKQLIFFLLILFAWTIVILMAGPK
jgi:hypothetical protein